MGDLLDCLRFLIAADLIVEADKLLAEANRVESRNAPWARNRRRKAGRLMDRAVALTGERGLPWGVAWEGVAGG